MLWESLSDKFCQYSKQLPRHYSLLIVVSYTQGALQKELVMAPFEERYKTATLGKSY